jgi:hypothetical protein
MSFMFHNVNLLTKIYSLEDRINRIRKNGQRNRTNCP